MKEGGQPMSPGPNSSIAHHAHRDQNQERQMALAALVHKRELRAAQKVASPHMVDSSERLREMLRQEFQRSTEYAKTCRKLQEQVASMEAKIGEADEQGRVTLELAEELSRARGRGHELSTLLSEQSAEMLARVGVHQQQLEDGEAKTSAMLVQSEAEGTPSASSSTSLAEKFVSSLEFVALGFALLVCVVALAFGTLFIAHKATSLYSGGKQALNMRRSVY